MGLAAPRGNFEHHTLAHLHLEDRAELLLDPHLQGFAIEAHWLVGLQQLHASGHRLLAGADITQLLLQRPERLQVLFSQAWEIRQLLLEGLAVAGPLPQAVQFAQQALERFSRAGVLHQPLQKLQAFLQGLPLQVQPFPGLASVVLGRLQLGHLALGASRVGFEFGQSLLTLGDFSAKPIELL